MSRVVVCGSLNMDVVVQSKRRPATGETLLGATVSFLPGGKGLNQAVAAARLGIPTAMVGTVGNDAFANSLRGFLADSDVDSSGVR
ncbi:MAG TPA: PfkB family carbohydrate kinase, partial [Reyranella sp.]|nr:PfkB family carbohydrate kinase [Reyranella sp.]